MNLTLARWALLGSNFAIGSGVMVTAGALNDLVQSLQVSVAAGGQLVAVAGLVMAIGAPTLAFAVSGWDRRNLLMLALLRYAAGHALGALMPDYGSLVTVRALTMLGAAVFAPQAAPAMASSSPRTNGSRHRLHPVCLRLLLVDLVSAGTVERCRSCARASADGTQHIGHVPGAGDRGRQRRLDRCPQRARCAELGSARLDAGCAECERSVAAAHEGDSR